MDTGVAGWMGGRAGERAGELEGRLGKRLVGWSDGRRERRSDVAEPIVAPRRA